MSKDGPMWATIKIAPAPKPPAFMPPEPLLE
jgi:hypothetical protein